MRTKRTPEEYAASRERIRDRLRAKEPYRTRIYRQGTLPSPTEAELRLIEKALANKYLPEYPRKWMCILLAEVRRLRKAEAKGGR